MSTLALSARAVGVAGLGTGQDPQHQRHHYFWPDASSLTHDAILKSVHLLGHRQGASACFLTVAVHSGGQFVTLDDAISLQVVHGAKLGDVARLIR
jgi:hypothetical protein